MLKKILSISGKPGLYKLISYGKSLIIVESLGDKKRMPVSARSKVISLGDVAIYTTGEDIPLSNVFDTMMKEFKGEINAADYQSDAQLREFFAKVLPTWDEDRVYVSDIKKVIAWYNVLVGAGITEFKAEEKPAEEEK